MSSALYAGIDLKRAAVPWFIFEELKEAKPRTPVGLIDPEFEHENVYDFSSYTKHWAWKKFVRCASWFVYSMHPDKRRSMKRKKKRNILSRHVAHMLKKPDHIKNLRAMFIKLRPKIEELEKTNPDNKMTSFYRIAQIFSKTSIIDDYVAQPIKEEDNHKYLSNPQNGQRYAFASTLFVNQYGFITKDHKRLLCRWWQNLDTHFYHTFLAFDPERYTLAFLFLYFRSKGILPPPSPYIGKKPSMIVPFFRLELEFNFNKLPSDFSTGEGSIIYPS